jgi:hypothetical protein
MGQLTEKQIENLKKLAIKSTSTEQCEEGEWNPYEMSGGNFDDCYWIGYEDAEIENARLILDLLEIEY